MHLGAFGLKDVFQLGGRVVELFQLVLDAAEVVAVLEGDLIGFLHALQLLLRQVQLIELAGRGRFLVEFLRLFGGLAFGHRFLRDGAMQCGSCSPGREGCQMNGVSGCGSRRPTEAGRPDR